MAFGFAAVCYIIALILTAFLIFFVIFHVSIIRKFWGNRSQARTGTVKMRTCGRAPADQKLRPVCKVRTLIFSDLGFADQNGMNERWLIIKCFI